MTRILHFGYLKKYSIIFIILTLFLSNNKISNKSIKLTLKDIISDTINLHFEKSIVLTFINEPSCTGCKEQLIKFLKENLKKNKIYILDWRSDIVSRKTYRNSLLNLDKKISTFYSISSLNNNFMLNDSLINISKNKSPFQVIIRKKNSKLEIISFDYNQIFESINLKNSYKDSLKKICFNF